MSAGHCWEVWAHTKVSGEIVVAPAHGLSCLADGLVFAVLPAEDPPPLACVTKR